jgi:hypothetical protein
MKVYVVVQESSVNNKCIGSQVLGVFHDTHDAIECLNKAYDKFSTAQLKDDTLRQSCYISEQSFSIVPDEVIHLAKEFCPKPDGFFHQTDESIYCMGFIEGYECKLATITE